MGAILLVAYGAYLVGVGIRGNAPALGRDLAQEKTFLYWIVVLLVVTALWESPAGEKVAKPLAALIVVGFLLRNGNWQKIGTNARAMMQGTTT